METPEINVADFLGEVDFGEVRIKIINSQLAIVPSQRIERPGKFGVRAEIIVDKPIRLVL